LAFTSAALITLGRLVRIGDTIMLMETQPNTENVVYIDEYPNLKKKVWLQRLAAQRATSEIVEMPRVIKFERTPDGAA